MSPAPKYNRFDRLAHLAALALRAPQAIIAVQRTGAWHIVGSAKPAEQAAATVRNSAFTAFLTHMRRDGPTIVADAHDLPDTCSHEARPVSYAACPFYLADGQTTGILCVFDAVARVWDAQAADILQESTHLAAFLLADIDVDKHMLSAELFRAQEAERQHIARELHDELGQELTIIQMALQDLQETQPARAENQLVTSIQLVSHLLNTVRTMALDLRPAQLDDLGLVPALCSYFERQANLNHLEFIADLPDDLLRLAPDIEIACFRIAQEAVTNILRSARAKRIWIHLDVEDAWLVLCVRDDGQGFDVAAAHARALGGHSLGLLGMHERASLVGGSVQIASTPGKGTLVQARLPLLAREGAT